MNSNHLNNNELILSQILALNTYVQDFRIKNENLKVLPEGKDLGWENAILLTLKMRNIS